MNIKFNEVTWYSRMAALILFLLIIPILTFYIGEKYNEAHTFDSLVSVLPSESGIYYNSGDGMHKAAPVQPVAVVSASSTASTSDRILNFSCAAGKKFSASYTSADNSPGPGAIYIPQTTTVLTLTLDGGKRTEILLDRPSASGLSFVNKSGTVVFKAPDEKASIQESGAMTYSGCVEI